MALDAGPVPLWQQVMELIHRNIATGAWRVDHQIPSERELCETYGISRTTVRLAIAEAVNAGLLRRTHGKGTFVAAPKISQPLFQITSFQETMKARGLEPATRLLEARQQQADLGAARMLGLPSGAEVVSFRLLGTGSGQPMALFQSTVPAVYGVPVWEEIERRKGTHSYNMINQLLAELHGWAFLQAEQTYEATLAGAEEARLLDLTPREPIFLVSSLFQNPAAQVVEFRRAAYRADKYQFHVTRQWQFQ